MSAVGRARELLRLTRGQRNDLVERTMETQAALDRAAFLVANTTPDVDCLLDVHVLQRRIEAQLARTIETARDETHATAGELEGLQP